METLGQIIIILVPQVLMQQQILQYVLISVDGEAEAGEVIII